MLKLNFFQAPVHTACLIGVSVDLSTYLPSFLDFLLWLSEPTAPSAEL